MSEQTQLTEILNLIPEPAFSVYDGIITQCNDAARRLLFISGLPVSPLILSDDHTYSHFEDGCLFLTLQHNGIIYGASVVRVQDANVFVLDADNDWVELKTLSLTAANMRQPLAAMMATTSSLASNVSKSSDPKVQEQLKHMNRSLCQMHRMLCNMSDALQYAGGTSNHMVCRNIVSVVEEIFHYSQVLCEESGIRLEYSVPNETILCAIDEQLLERGIYNMLSNAIKFSEPGSIVHASLTHQEKRLYISVRDYGSGIPASILGSIFQRYQRQPGLEDSRYGLGLGLVMVRCTARVHGGTVLVDQPENIGSRITVSIPILQNSSAMLRSDITRVDYASGLEHGLLELSDVLPAHLY